jgi:LacI family transcriptional regulator
MAGVSPATVSRALNSPAMLDADTLSRVQDAIQKLRYMPNAQARALRNQRSFTLGAVVPTFNFAFYAATTGALESAIEPQGFALFLASHQFDLAREVHLTRALIERGVEAFMFIGLDHDPELFVLLNEYKRPYVLAWALDRTGRHASVGYDIFASMSAITNQLIDLGHTRIGVVSAPHVGNDLARDRCAGVRSAMLARGLHFDASHIAFSPISVTAATEATKCLLALSPRPTAIIGTNDALAVGALNACRSSGIHVPKEMSIVGGNSELGTSQSPSLSGIRAPVAEIGRVAAEILLARLDGIPTEQTRELPFELSWRESTGAAPPKN